MQKLLLAFVSVVTLMGLVAPSSAIAVQEQSDARGLNPWDPPTRRAGNNPHPSPKSNNQNRGEKRDLFEPPTRRAGNGPHPSPKSNNQNRGEQRDLFEPPTRRAGNGPHPSPKSNNQNRGEQRDLSEHPARRGDEVHERQERNSDRLARGLPPLPPARRGSASLPKPFFNHLKEPDYHVEIRDTNGKSLGFLTEFTGGGQDLLVEYHPSAYTLSFDGNNVGDAHFLGAHISQTDLGSNSPAFVYLTKVRADDQSANANIWSLDGNKLIATWKNSDGTTAPVYFCVDNAGNMVLAGNPSLLPSGYREVYFYLDN